MQEADAKQLVSQGNLSIKEAMKFSGWGRTQIFKLLREGRLVASRSGKGGKRLIPRRALIEVMAEELKRELSERDVDATPAESEGGAS